MRTETAIRRNVEAAAERRANLVEDVEFLLTTGEWAERIAQRCGYCDIDSIAKALSKAGRADLVAQLRMVDRLSQYFRRSLIDDQDRRIAELYRGRRR